MFARSYFTGAFFPPAFFPPNATGAFYYESLSEVVSLSESIGHRLAARVVLSDVALLLEMLSHTYTQRVFLRDDVIHLMEGMAASYRARAILSEEVPFTEALNENKINLEESVAWSEGLSVWFNARQSLAESVSLVETVIARATYAAEVEEVVDVSEQPDEQATVQELLTEVASLVESLGADSPGLSEEVVEELVSVLAELTISAHFKESLSELVKLTEALRADYTPRAGQLLRPEVMVSKKKR